MEDTIGHNGKYHLTYPMCPFQTKTISNLRYGSVKQPQIVHRCLDKAKKSISGFERKVTDRNKAHANLFIASWVQIKLQARLISNMFSAQMFHTDLIRIRLHRCKWSEFGP